VALILGGAGCDGDDEDPSAVSLVAQEVGPCLFFEEDVGPEVETLPVVDCLERHTHEVFAIEVSDETVYPGFDALEDEAQRKCFQQFEGYVGINPFDSELFVSWLVPTLASWEQEDRQIVCVAGNTNGAPFPPGSVKGSGR
jgi:hypothetical protein